MPIVSRRSRAACSADIAVTSSPSMCTVPESGRISAAATASRLDLPDPEAPVIAVTVPGRAVTVTWSTARRRPAPSG